MTDEGKAFRDERVKRLKARTAIIADTRAEILRILEEAQKRITLILAAQPSDAQRWQLTQLQREITQAMQEFSTAAGAQISTAAGQAWAAGQALVDAPLSAGGIHIAGLVPILETRQLLAMRAFMTDRIKDIGVQAANKINTQLGLVMIGAQPQADAVTTVTEVLQETSRKRAINMVRSNLSMAYGVASFERLKQSATVVPGLKKQWRRSGKVHSRIAHDLADGQVKDIDEPFVIYSKNGKVEMRCPHDPAAPIGEWINCGCTMLPWKEGWEVASPGRRRYTEAEMEANPMKRDIQEALDKGTSIADVLDGQRAA